MSATPEELEAAVDLLKSNGFVAYRKTNSKRSRALGIDEQKLWLCRFGTVAALVWARTEDNARDRVRHRVYDRYASVDQIEREPVVVFGEILVREATAADLVEFEEAGGRVPA